ncbi:50S ribosomal protein L24 [Candidatus Wolfebacteria bacterium]|nr:MAG: 50S ribosomal protein L24 [Candidatus Wolfebacteria bacterium]
MKIKKNDTVIILSGKDKGAKGKVIKAIPAKDMVVVEGVNKVKKHQKARQAGKKGQTIEVTLPLHVSNVALIDPKKDKATRIRIENKKGKNVRVTVKSGSEI